jgi:autoinducer 2-degrading protein
MSSFVIMVDFRLKAGSMAAFRRLIDANARASVRDEPGCRRFDVMVAKGETDRVMLYEIYDDRAAFEAHLKTPHFASFNAESATLVSDKTVFEYALVCEGTDAA